MPQVSVGECGFEVESIGDADRPAVLLVMGLGMQLTAWPQPLCDALVEAGYRVVRFDNRDIGLSHKCDEGGRVNLPRQALRWFLRLPLQAPYLVPDMAQDALGVLDALGIDKAHVVGASMGGMIAQEIAARAPQRCLSLTSVMSSSGDRRLPTARARVLKLMLTQPPSRTSFERLVDHYVRLFQALSGPGYPISEAELRERLRLSLSRSYHPAGTARQLLAIAASGDRSDSLRRIQAPTLVLHGDADPLLPLAHGIDSARKIPGARLEVVPGMGHDLPPTLLPLLGNRLLAHFASASH